MMRRESHHEPTKRHHPPEGFQNTYIDFVSKSLMDVLRWKWNSARNGLLHTAATPIVKVDPDLAFLWSNANAGTVMLPSLTWIGHASVMVQLGGTTLLTGGFDIALLLIGAYEPR